MQKDIGGNSYLIGKMDAFEQLHVARRLGPAVVTVLQSFMAMPDGELSADSILQVMIGIAGVPIADVFAKMSNEDVNYIVKACLSVCRRLHSGGQSPVMPNGTMMFSDIEIDSMLGLVYAVLQENLGRFFPMSQSAQVTSK